ncbi:MAG: ArgE/DapE family deacylase [Elusimicrobia bacterium]|jgi:acetylornithine deacetylase|nr:ArgE/DapE family deacylase [Elusimicrobiota bacterium]
MNITKHVEDAFPEAIDFLKEIMRIPSVSGVGEEDVQYVIRDKFSQFGNASLVPVPDTIKQDPEYTFAERELDYSKRKNVVLELPSEGQGKSLIINSHSDVVPAENWADAFNPQEKDGIIYGRGACDAKGQIATIYLTLLALKQLGVKLQGKLTVQAVIEEEVGGNGALSLIRDGYKADGVIVLEPTELKISPANRGAVWYKLEVKGKSVHMGRITEGVNAIEKTCILMHRMKEYESRLIEDSKNVPLFEKYRQPVQVNFGTIKGDGWPSMVCGYVALEGGVGFLPNKDLATIKRELTGTIEECGDHWILNNYKLSFHKLHNDAYAIPADHPLVEAMKQGTKDIGADPVVDGFLASCDARLFNKVGKMPVVVFGPGKIEDAHSDTEKIKTEEIKKAAEILTAAVINWCGVIS